MCYKNSRVAISLTLKYLPHLSIRAQLVNESVNISSTAVRGIKIFRKLKIFRGRLKLDRQVFAYHYSNILFARENPAALRVKSRGYRVEKSGENVENWEIAQRHRLGKRTGESETWVQSHEVNILSSGSASQFCRNRDREST